MLLFCVVVVVVVVDTFFLLLLESCQIIRVKSTIGSFSLVLDLGSNISDGKAEKSKCKEKNIS